MSQQNHLQIQTPSEAWLQNCNQVFFIKNNCTPIYVSETSNICCWFGRSEEENLRAEKITENLEEGPVPKRLTWVGAEKIDLGWCRKDWGNSGAGTLGESRHPADDEDARQHNGHASASSHQVRGGQKKTKADFLQFSAWRSESPPCQTQPQWSTQVPHYSFLTYPLNLLQTPVCCWCLMFLLFSQ